MESERLANIIQPLPFKDIYKHESLSWVKRVLEFNPSEVYDRIIVDNYSRFPSVSVVTMFPKVKGICGCGCGRELKGRSTRWFSLDCSKFTYHVWAIISGRTEIIGYYLRTYYDWKCFECRCEDKGHATVNGMIADIKIDHIIPVKLGGGGGWLSNYQLLCHNCHVGKTNKDFGWKKPQIEQPKLF